MPKDIKLIAKVTGYGMTYCKTSRIKKEKINPEDVKIIISDFCNYIYNCQDVESFLEPEDLK